MNSQDDKDVFLATFDHHSLASFFNLSYKQLANIIYPNVEKNYSNFTVPKKNGGNRLISVPSYNLKKIQSRLTSVLYSIYPGKPAAHGFSLNKSIVTNASAHVYKKCILNFDLENFFGTIHFGRIRNIFSSKLFDFNHATATILAQICCLNNSLPQGAPTSPILSNIVAWKLDAEMQYLAKKNRFTYTRYVDDITLSFSCSLNRIPHDIVSRKDDVSLVGSSIRHIVSVNGFKINDAKTRLCDKHSRLEVTGLTVNEFVNVRRTYIREIFSILNAWRRYGYVKAENKYNSIHFKECNRSKKLDQVIKGKISFLKNVLGEENRIYKKIAHQFNLLADDKYKFIIHNPINTYKGAIASLWIIESCYDDDDKDDCIVSQGTGFSLDGIGIITCSHVVGNESMLYENLEIYKHEDQNTRHRLIVKKICRHRDVAICEIENKKGFLYPKLYKSNIEPEIRDKAILMGFPGFSPGQQHNVSETRINSVSASSAVKKFEVDTYIREGISGGPVLDTDYNVLGFALKGVRQGTGRNDCLNIAEVISVFNDQEYNV